MTGASRIGMTGRAYQSRRPQRAATVTSRADWHGLLALAASCAEDARGVGTEPDPALRLATLGNRINGAKTDCFSPAGAATGDVARAFVRVTQAFARSETPADLRTEMAAMVADGVAFLDTQLHRISTTEFERAHRGRPEVYG